ncbi:M20/M25/M40 family metallo-hydrolase [Fusobacterium ulcerans]|uniref:Uncharacterized protein n=1 Tax=Fusobacterium ulcerans 12-1B TaxID=457404 RepID=S2KXN5_9FUSO|nr:M20/M25/M40 family metallo-hydrolase [Fusobacterium ulcerans]EPC09034.1 hypothetical protein HMPREF0402_04248 [Fusobacterium ulcerans 12-1B]
MGNGGQKGKASGVKSISVLDKILNYFEVIGNKLPDPVSIFVILCAAVLIISFICSKTGVAGEHPLTHKMITALSKKTLGKIVGEENVIVMEEPLMGSEDFSYFGKKVPSNFFLVGVRDAQEDIESMLHHPRLLWDEKYLKINAKALSQLVIDFLNK